METQQCPAKEGRCFYAGEISCKGGRLPQQPLPQFLLARIGSRVHALTAKEAGKQEAGIFRLWDGMFSAIKKGDGNGLCAYNQQCLPHLDSTFTEFLGMH